MTLRSLDGIRHLLLDFDGPIAAIFAGGAGPRIAADLWRKLDPSAETPSGDPFDILRAAARRGASMARHTEAALTHLETLAAENAAATPYAADVVRAAHESGRSVAIVSNNSAPAIRRYLDRHGITPDAIIGRDSSDPGLLKPSPHLVSAALTSLSAAPEAAVLVGDSTTDIQAAHAAGVAAIGYANKPGKAQRLTDIGADAIITTMGELVPALAGRPLD